MERLTARPIEVAGETLVVRGDRSLFWPRENLLIVADVHLGKSESARSLGVAIPAGVMADDLARLSAALGETSAATLLILGDLVHDARGLSARVRARVAYWRSRHAVSVDLVLGNHDRRAGGVPAEWDMRVYEAPLQVGPFIFSHDAATADGYNWYGHVHPSVTLHAGGDRLRIPCFQVGARRALLPAFSAFTGGARIDIAPGDRLFGVVDGFVVPLASPA